MRILPDNLFLWQAKSREGRTQAEQARDLFGAHGLFCDQDYKAQIRINQMEAASTWYNKNEILLSSIKSECQAKTKVVE